MIEEDGAQLVFKANTAGKQAHIMTHDGSEDINLDPSGFIQFECAGSERMRIDSSGRLLVGGTDASVVHTNADNVVIGNTSASVAGLSIATSTSGYATLQFSDGAGNKNQGQIAYNHADNSLAFTTDSSVRMKVDSSGNVGIGTTSPAGKLHISSGTSGDCELILEADTDNNEEHDNPRILFRQDGGIDESAIQNSDNKLELLNSVSNGGIIFKLGTTNGYTNAVERMRIDSSGNTFVNCTSDPVGQSAKFAVQHGGDGQSVASFDFDENFSRPNMFIRHARAGAVSGTKIATMIAFLNLSGVQVGTIKSGLAGTSFNTSSDYRLKENITNISDGITRIKQLIPKKFNFIGDGDKTLKDGFLAHEVSSVVPEAITGTKDEVDENNEPVYQGIDQSKLVPLLVAALQEAIGRIEALEAK